MIGPNGCGKSTLLRALGRLLQAHRGQVLLDGKRIDRIPTREVAKVLGLLPQAPIAPEGLTVADLVARGRHPHQAWYRQWSADDEDAVAEALDWTGIADLAERPVDELSGGQRQRAWISMALAQGTDLLLLDEPTTFLDLAHQVDVLDLVRRLHTEAGRTVVMVLHDLNLAARYADRLVAMRDGRIVAAGEAGRGAHRGAARGGVRPRRAGDPGPGGRHAAGRADRRLPAVVMMSADRACHHVRPSTGDDREVGAVDRCSVRPRGTVDRGRVPRRFRTTAMSRWWTERCSSGQSPPSSAPMW